MRRLIVAALLCLSLTLAMAGPALACSIIPWRLDGLVQGSQALVLGRVLTTTDGGRQVNVEVLAYAGTGAAPRYLALPATEDGGSKKWGCPDTSSRFVEGRTYLVFLSQGMPLPQLASRQTPTAVELDEQGWVPTGPTPNQGQRLLASDVLQEFAARHSYPVQRSPGEANGALGIALGVVGLALLAACAGLGLARTAPRRRGRT